MTSFFASVGVVAGGEVPGGAVKLSTLAIELPPFITPTVAGLTVGAFVGVVGFVAVLLLVGRAPRRAPPRAMASADSVVYIPPYIPAHAPPPAPVAVADPFAAPAPRAPAYGSPSGYGQTGHTEVLARGALPFRPSTALSARAFAKMGYASDGLDRPDSDPELYVDMGTLEPDEELAVEHPVSVAPVFLAAPPAPSAPLAPSAPSPAPAASIPPPVLGPRDPSKSGPHPLGIIPSSSAAMRAVTAASIADLELDDDATQIAETIFDEPPQPRRRTDPPKIRPIAPSPPRFPSSAPTPLLPAVTPPPVRVRQA